MKLLLKISGSVLIGLLVTIFLLQNDDQFKTAVHDRLKVTFEQMFDCSVDYKIKSINFFLGKLYAQEVQVACPDGTWSWQAKEFTLDISWLSLLSQGKVGLDIDINNLKAHSQIIDNQVAIGRHLALLVSGASSSPLVLKSQNISKGTLLVCDAQKTIEGNFSFSYQRIIR